MGADRDNQKIYILPVPAVLQPPSAPFRYPRKNDDFGVEQDFLKYLHDNNLVSRNPSRAQWHYLPIFWTRYQLWNDYGRRGQATLQRLASSAVIDAAKTFSVVQFAGGPPIPLAIAKWFLSSRTGSVGSDIPLINSAIPQKWRKHRNRIRPLSINFVGRDDTHPIRKTLPPVVRKLRGFSVSHLPGNLYFTALQFSRVTAAPRGFGGSSYRFFEACAAGSVPALIGDIDTRVFSDAIDWPSMSFFVASAQELLEVVNSVSHKQLEEMSRMVHYTYWNFLAPGAWPRLVLGPLLSERNLP